MIKFYYKENELEGGINPETSDAMLAMAIGRSSVLYVPEVLSNLLRIKLDKNLFLNQLVFLLYMLFLNYDV